ncbi:MAG: type IV secretory system conjugative DNA transfer family protein, partial [Ktedonobacteraceae bacterium]|nr:type IV secretory system conjugative DNA transfer family protein [Ktedonobacteraceae bacterium]
MKWIRYSALSLCVFATLLVAVYAAPWLFPQVMHTSVPTWISQLHTLLLPGEPANLLVLAPTNAWAKPFTWLALGEAVALYLLASINLKYLRHRRVPYGSAAYAGRHDIRHLIAPRTALPWRLAGSVLHAPVSLAIVAARMVGAIPQTLLLQRSPQSWFQIGTYRGRVIALTEKQQEEHLLLTAPTGSGKSSLEIIPNVLREQGSRSVFIADLKNELYRTTAGALAQHHQVWWFNPAQPERSHSYNPLVYVKDAMDANMLADCWIKNTGEGDDPYWSNSAQLLISAVILHLRKTEPLAPFSRLCDVMTGKSFEELKELLTTSPSREARRKATSFLNNMGRNERLVGSIMTEIGNRFQLFDSESVRTVTGINEIDFETMMDEPTALYLSIPRSEVDVYRPLMACFTMQLFRTWEQRANRSGTLPRGIACYLDEFANIGYIPGYAHFVSTARYLRVSLIMAIQNFAQLDDRYGPQAAETIRENANTHLLLPGAGLRECQYYSERIGDTSVPIWSQNTKIHGGLFFGVTED